MPPRTLNDIFLGIAERKQEKVMLERNAGVWLWVSSAELYCRVLGLARALRRWGIEKGDRVALLSENRVEWAVTDFACLLLGAVVVPIYCTLTPEQTCYILCDSGSSIIVLSTHEQLQKVLSIRDRTSIKRIILMDGSEANDAVPWRELMSKGPTGRDLELEGVSRKVTSEDPASIIYTSGTTGISKGVQLTHGNLTSNVLNSLYGFDIGSGHTSVSFLPLSHVTARHVDIALLNAGVTLAYCPSIEELPRTLQEVRPTIFVAVPRVYEKMFLQVQQAAEKFPKKEIFHWAVAIGKSRHTTILRGDVPKDVRWKVADRLVYSKIRARLGGRVQIFVSGGAPLGRELAEWYANVGIRIHEGYGLTETSPVIAINNPRAYRMGSVGRPLANVEVKIADDSEILVRGPSVFRAYWNRPEETRDAFVDGWFRTGDIGNIDHDGFLSVTDRKKDLLKTSGGKFIAPQPVENSLKLNALISAAVMLGDRRKFPSVLISPHFPSLEDWARTHKVSYSTRAALVTHPKVQALYEDIVGEVNRGLARYETLKKILLVPDEFSSSDGTLTPTLKLRRRAIEERYRHQIDALYAESFEESPRSSRCA